MPTDADGEANVCTGDQYDALLFTGLEIWLVIICGTIPTIKPVWDVSSKFFSGLFGGKSNSTEKYGKGSLNSTNMSYSKGNQTRITVKESPWNNNRGGDDPAANQRIQMYQTVDVQFSKGREKLCSCGGVRRP